MAFLRETIIGSLLLMATLLSIASFIYFGYAVVPSMKSATEPTATATPTGTLTPTATSTATETPTMAPSATSTRPAPIGSISQIRVEPSRTFRYRILDLRRGQTLEGFFQDERDNSINFWIEDPQGKKVYDAGRVSRRHDFRLKIDLDGTYSLVFDLSFSLLTGRTMTLQWRAF